MKSYLTFCLGLTLTAAAHGQRTTLWDESVNGPLAEVLPATSLAPLLSGTNIVIGASLVERTGNNWFGHDDLFTFTVPIAMTVGAIYLHLDKPDVWAWIGDPSFSTELAFVQNSTAGELLSQWNLSSLPPGGYGMYLSNHDRQSSSSIASYRVDFYVVPEPNAAALFLIGGFALLAIRRRTLSESRGS